MSSQELRNLLVKETNVSVVIKSFRRRKTNKLKLVKTMRSTNKQNKNIKLEMFLIRALNDRVKYETIEGCKQYIFNRLQSRESIIDACQKPTACRKPTETEIV